MISLALPNSSSPIGDEKCSDSKLDWSEVDRIEEQEDKRAESVSIPLTPGDELVRDLELLRQKMSKLVDRLNQSGVERTFHLRRLLGANCHNYRKSMTLFVDGDFEDIRDMIADLQDQFIIIEGKVATHG
jgi:hypothetical protein